MFQLNILQLCLVFLPMKKAETDIQICLGKAQKEGEKPRTSMREEFLPKMANPLLKGGKLGKCGIFLLKNS